MYAGAELFGECRHNAVGFFLAALVVGFFQSAQLKGHALDEAVSRSRRQLGFKLLLDSASVEKSCQVVVEQSLAGVEDSAVHYSLYANLFKGDIYVVYPFQVQ